MKFLRVIFLLILVALIWSGARKKSAVAQLRTAHETLVARATAIGLPEKESDDARASTRLSSRGPSQKWSPEHLKDELVAAYLRLKSIDDSKDPETRMKVEAEVREWIGRLIDLSPKELKRMIADLKSDPSLDSKGVPDLVGISLYLAAARQGETAAQLALENRELVGSVSRVVGNWAQQDPSNAFAWLEKNREALGKDYEDALQQAIRQSASRDPGLALANLSRIGTEGKRTTSANALARSLTDDGARASLVAELRVSTLDSTDRNNVLTGLGNGLMEHSPTGPGAWMKELSADEAVTVAEGLSRNMNASPRPDAWLEWMEKSLPPERLADTARPMLTKWINDDYQAAGEWINRQPAGGLRNDAAANYARMMAKRFPDTARDWAATLPEGPEKQRLLEDLNK
ncbi:MAG: hypothetical protein CFE26_00700 [Verrucomicrobiales bacterium VVV1]|nr:MAG: hypothetical protein CFE26_00700 [Verrucomicrobiales bacterium VVV1]